MSSFYIEFEGLVPEFSNLIVEADDHEHADAVAREQIGRTYPEMSDVLITKVEEQE